MSEVLYYFLGFSAIYILMGWALYLPYRRATKLSHSSMHGYNSIFRGFAAREWNWPFPVILIIGIMISTIIGLIFLRLLERRLALLLS